MSDNDKFRDILLHDRYLLPSEKTWEDLCERVSKFLANSAEEEEEFYDIMVKQIALPGSPTLMNAGTKHPMLSSCFILPVEDSLDSIMQTVKDAAIVTARGGGIGFDFSKIRPAGSLVSSTCGAALGPLGVIRILDGVINEIKQSGRRRGALMGVLDINHPDVDRFIECKKVDGTITNFNLSVMVNDEFINKVRAGDERSNTIWTKVIANAHANGEPGVMFYDNINRVSPYLKHGIKITASNPCGELSAPDWASCNLASINLSKFVNYSAYSPFFNITTFTIAIHTMVKLLNRVIDKNELPLENLTKFITKWRPIGLGIMGFHDALIKLGYKYGSDESFAFAELVASVLKKETDNLKEKYGNTTSTTIAPTGSISILAGCSWSIEPIFDYKVRRFYTDNSGEKYEFNLVHELFQEQEDRKVYDPNVFIKSSEIDPRTHLKVQSIFQNYVDTAISKTIILPHDITLEDTKGIYLEAHRLGCKGVTIYRDMSRANQVYQKVEEKEIKDVPRVAREDHQPAPPNRKERPRSLPGYTTKCRVSGGSFYVTINYTDGTAFEVFATPSVEDGSPDLVASTEALTRIISLGLRHGISKDDIAKQLKRVRGQSLLSMPGQLGRILEEFEAPEAAGQAPVVPRRYCPSCEKELTFDGSCWHCENCGWAKCE